MDTHTSSTPGPLATGAMLGRYKIVRLLGTGGMGAVYEATHVDLQKRVALKVLHPAVALDADVMARFLREGRAASQIRHPNAVDVSDVGQHDGRAFLVMEFLDGVSLAARIANGGPMSPEQVADVLLPVIAALNAAHREGVVHRDLKPDNIFLARTRDGIVQPKVVDFGISKFEEPTGSSTGPKTSTSSVFGTPQYMSPEQLTSTKNVGPHSDQYALGVIMYECCTGICPFTGETVFVIFEAVMAGRYARPTELRPELPAKFEAVVLRAMSIAREKRYPSLAALAFDLLPFAKRSTHDAWEPVFRQAAESQLAEGPTEFAMPGSSTTLGSVVVSDRSVASQGPASRAPMFAALGALAVAALGVTTWAALAGHHGAARAPAVLAAQPTPPAASVAAPIAPAVPATAASSPVAPASAPTIAATAVAPPPVTADASTQTSTAAAHESAPAANRHAAHHETHATSPSSRAGTNDMPY